MMILRNWSALVRREWAVTVAFSIWASAEGMAPIWPAATWVFCAWIALTTSAGTALTAASL